MFIGHFAAGLAAKRIDRTPSLGTLIFATLLPDLVMPFFLLAGIERVKIQPGNTAFTPLDLVFYPFSHSLVSILIQALIFGIVYYLIKRNVKTSLLLSSLVIFHFVLDLISHRPDLQLVWWSEYRVGLGLWNSVGWTILLESLLFFAGTFLYFQATKTKNRFGIISPSILLIFLGVLYLMSAFGPPPPGEREFAYAGLLAWLFVGWGYWIDKNRVQTDSNHS